MFGLFKKSPKVDVVDRVYMTTESKGLACSQIQKEDRSTLFVTWFEDSLPWLREWIESSDGSCCHVSDPALMQSQGRSIVFVEHYPMQKLEQELFMKLGLKEVVVLSALDEPLFELFGSERIIRLMQQMGMKEDEMVQHPMVSASIGRAQSKIAEHVTQEKIARSQKEWFDLNHKK